LEAYRAAQGPPLIPLRIDIPTSRVTKDVEPMIIRTSIRESPELYDRLQLHPPPRPRPTSVYSPMGLVRKVTLFARPKVGRTQSTGDVPGGSSSSTSSTSSSRTSNRRSTQMAPQRRQSDISSELVVQSLQNPRRDSPSPSPSNPPRSKSSRRPMTAPIQTSSLYLSSGGWNPRSTESSSPISSEELTTPTSTNGSSSAGESSSSLTSSRPRTVEESRSTRRKSWRDSLPNPFSPTSPSSSSFDQVVRSPGMFDLDTMSEEEDGEARKKMEKRGKRMSLTGVAGELVSRAFKSSFGGPSKGRGGSESRSKEDELESERDGTFQVMNQRPPISRSHSTPSSLLSLPPPPLQQPTTPSLDLGSILEGPEDLTPSPSALTLSTPLPPSPPISILNFDRSSPARSLKTRPRVKSLLTTTRPSTRPVVERRNTGDGVVLPLHARDIFGSSTQVKPEEEEVSRGEEESMLDELELVPSRSLSLSIPSEGTDAWSASWAGESRSTVCSSEACL
jgi:hypothetical protein